MRVFNTAMRVFFRHPLYLVIYIIWLGFMGVFVGMSLASTTQSVFSTQHPDVAIIDRDDSAFSEGLSSFLADHSQIVTVADDERSLQDATAQNQAAYIVIIPEGFGDDFMAAAQGAGDFPILETVVSYESFAGPMMDELTNEYLDTASVYVATGTATDQTQVARLAAGDLEGSTAVSIWQKDETRNVSNQYWTYMNFSVYPAMLSIIICVAVVMAAFKREEVRRRDLASSASSLSVNLQLGLACLVITVIAWAWIGSLGLIVFGNTLSGVSVQAVVSGLASLFAFCLFALALGFLLGQLTGSELVMNAAGNITGLILSFLGGTWISLDLAGEPVRTIAHLVPTYYYNSALSSSFDLQTTGAAGTLLGDIGIMLLFAAATFAIALAIGRTGRHASHARALPPAA